MKHLLMTVCIVVTATSALAATHVSHWDFSSDPLGEFDYTGHNDLVNSEGVTIADGALVFDGKAKEFITGHNVDFRNNQAYTIECFAQADSDCDGMIMELTPNIANPGSQGSFYIYAKEGVMVNGSGNGKNGVNFDSGSICDGQWHHIAMIVNPAGATAADKVQLYLDRIRQTHQVQNKTDACLNPHRLYIGSRGGKSLPFKGMIDDVRITEGILSTDQFLQTRSENNGLDVRAYWKFDDGNALADASGNGNTLHGSQGVTFANGYASFNGTASDVRTANALDFSAYNDATIEFFVRKHDEADALGMVMELSPNATSHSGAFYFSLNEAGVGAVNGLFRLADGYRSGNSPANTLNAGWHHVALVKDSSNSGNAYCISLYVDGVRMSNYTGNARNSSYSLCNDILYIGSRKNSEFFLDADIDDIRVTAQALQPGQFLRKRTGALEDVIAYWPFEKPSNMLVDVSGNGNLLTGSGVTVNESGAAVFDGSQSGFATLAPLPLYSYRSMTVEWFMKSTSSDVCIVMETSANALGNSGAFYAAANEYAGYQMTRTHNLLRDWSAADGEWHHYALVYDWDSTTEDIVRIYRDGVKMTTHFSGNTSAARLRADKLFIGARNGSQYPFVGQLDDIKITGRALAPAEFMTARSKSQRGLVILVK